MKRIDKLLTIGAALGIALILALGASACGGDGDDGGGEGGETKEALSAAGDDLTIDPESGPPGTAIAWAVANCDPSSEKSVSLYTGSPGGQEDTKKVVGAPDTKEDNGTITVPPNTTPGEYTVIATCLTTTEQGGGQVQLGIRDAGELAFTVTE